MTGLPSTRLAELVMRRHFLLLLALSFPAAALGQTSFPMITHVHPVAIQRGKSAEVTVNGQMNFFGAYKSLFEGKGLSAEVLPSAAPPMPGTATPVAKSAKLKVTAAADAPLGVREFRVACSHGLSSVGQLVVVDDPVVLEAANNNTIGQAQKIALPTVVAGNLEAAEDVDFYQFEAKAGERVTFELFCARLQDKIHDLQKHAKPMLTLYDSEGRELAANDTFYFADPMLSFAIPKTGTYYLQVRESTYDGDPRWVYALIATTKPYATHAFPMAGNPGKTLEVEAVGGAKKAKLTLPTEPGIHLSQLEVGDGKTNPVTTIVSDLPQFVEQEPNDDPNAATRVTIPAGINGRIGKRRDMDHYAFAAKKGQSLRMELKARRFGTLLNSALHGVLEVMDKKGTLLSLSDATHGPEASLVFPVPADGDYVLRVRDLNSKGSDAHVYYVEIDEARPDFTIRCDPDKAMMGPGTSAAWYVHVVRQNGFAGPVKVEIDGLPPEIKATPLTIAATMTQGMMVLTADEKANPMATEVSLKGTATIKDGAGKESTIVRHVTPNQEIYSPGGGRAKFDVATFGVAVTTTSDIQRVDVKPREVVLKPGDEVKIEVNIVRRGDFTQGVSLDVNLAHLGSIFGNPLPPGVTVVTGKSKTLLGAGSVGHIVLKAAPNADPIEQVPISVVANVSVNFVVKMAYSSPAILISIRK